MNNHHKLISLYGAPHKSMGEIFSKKSFSCGTNVFGQKNYGMAGLMIRSCQGRGGDS